MMIRMILATAAVTGLVSAGVAAPLGSGTVKSPVVDEQRIDVAVKLFKKKQTKTVQSKASYLSSTRTKKVYVRNQASARNTEPSPGSDGSYRRVGW